jgi:uncharacterized protein
MSGRAIVAVRARNLTRSTELAGDVEVASSFWARFMGLMGRGGLPPGHGLWIPNDNGIHMFFMRFAIDAVFLGPRGDGPAEGEAAEGEAAPGSRPVVALRPRLAPWLGIVPLVRGAQGVLELPAGTIEATGSHVGARISIG